MIGQISLWTKASQQKKGQQQKTLSTFYLLHKKQTHNRGGQHNWNKFLPLNPCFLSSAQHLPKVLSPFIYISHWREFLSPLKVAKPAACTSLYGCLSKFSSRSKCHLLTFGGGCSMRALLLFHGTIKIIMQEDSSYHHHKDLKHPNLT